MFLTKKRRYHETIHDDTIGMKETICDGAIGMKSGFVGHRLLKQPGIAQVVDLFEARSNTVAC